MQITLYGRLPSLKNSKQIVYIKGRMLIIPSKNYKEWHSIQKAYILNLNIKEIIKVCNIEITIYFPDKRKSDLINKAEGILDLLSELKVIEDDNHEVIKKLVLITGGVDKINPRAEIIITAI